MYYTTSSRFGQGKTKFNTLLSKTEPLDDQVEVFLWSDFTPQALRDTGIKCFEALQGGGIVGDTLYDIRGRRPGPTVPEKNLMLAN